MKRNNFTLIIMFIATFTFSQNVKANNINDLFTVAIDTEDHYVPGTTMDINFVLDFRTADFEYGDYIRLTFPDGITPNGSPTDPFAPVREGQGTENLNGVSGQEISWGSNNNDEWGGIEIGVHAFIVNVTIDAGVTGDQIINIIVSGSEFGTPQGDVNTTCQIREFPAGPDLKVFATKLEYTNYPLSQASNLPISGIVKNLGLDLSNAPDLVVTCDEASYAETATISSPLAHGTAQAFILPGVASFTEGTHEIVFNATASNDPYVSNNSDTITIGIDSVYSHDDGGIAYTFGHQFIPYRMGSVFDIITPDELSAVQFYLGQTAPVGNEFSLTVSPITISRGDVTLGDPVWESRSLFVDDSMLDVWTTVNVPDGILLGVEEYVLTINEISMGSIELGFDGNPDGDIYRAFPGGDDYLEDEAFGYPMLRLILGLNPTSDIAETVNKEEISIFPNPTTGVVNIKNAKNKNVAVYNIKGIKVAEINNASHIETIDVSKYTSGSYIIKIGSESAFKFLIH